ncbi:IclR family transcriptional regulator [Hyphomonas sp.]|jgi:DNA-binding IclR family transcriptional regulator|uniref:IclR family transcriptional regulator n=1 Tax=Hyphomonas sp. TaxID=87 RepID=UPI0032D8F72A
MTERKKKAKNAPQGAKEKSPGGAQTLMRGLDVLEMVRDGPVSLLELSENLGLTRSTAHRLAAALVERQYLSFTPRSGYSLGPLILALGHCASIQIQLARVARPILEDLAKQTDDIVHLGVIEGDEVLYLEKVPGKRRILISSHVGERQPIATTGLGKALILEESEEYWKRLYGMAVSKPRESLSAWMDRMKVYQKDDYALDLEENEDRVRCVAAPIRDVENRIVAAISVSSAAQYMSDDRMRALVPIVQEATRAISRELGWQDPGV